MDDEFILQGANQQSYATRRLQERMDERIARAPYLNIKLAKGKSEFLHIFKPKQPNKDDYPIIVYDEEIKPAKSIKSIGIIIDKHLNFRQHANRNSARNRRGCGWLSTIARRKGTSPSTIHHIATTITIPTFLYGSEIWCTETNLSLTSPARHTTK